MGKVKNKTGHKNKGGIAKVLRAPQRIDKPNFLAFESEAMGQMIVIG